ncbi:uncharacterized protein BDR25DRAFT_39818 [Lindgomyces ingoldianus]|uniref:Uncharacterized protein n=1 Tax=Lindgomyces ingoldianus TaxID=673940 RepID=A0ACB6QUP8_9PLEO|nr:uncharacterized protein BDR25DRAFT_39818 [Lindgomyces ingoldianus]KAF2469807.1 hypothetical protein BDR25DRAFT_39818 [Lindgomyces ingoldianus]
MSAAGPTLLAGKMPSRSLFEFPPHMEPAVILPPFQEPSFKTPFPISSEFYNGALSTVVPLTIAVIYATTVFFVNAYNRRHKNQPWAISKTRLFKAFVILHNVLLAIYSAVTCVAMVRALKHAIPHYTEPNALVGTVDALCKMHGPRGLGDAAAFNITRNAWEVKNNLIHLGNNDIPDSTDLGRVWNEGLAFWGFIFYLSKFYEVLDTFIILAKGKRSTTLQTYHHAGAMLCMWAGIRFMSPPIWMFALVNSGIHAMMYSYYTISALGVRVPQAVKRTLTSLQILQFVVGASFAAVHLFVSYTIPVQVAYEVAATPTAITAPSSSVFSAFVSAITVPLTSSPALSTATGAALDYLKKLVYRAAGEEGLAENVVPAPGVTHFPGQAQGEPQHILQDTLKQFTYRTEYHEISCIDTTGQAFAIYLNLIYLAPLTGLFVRFFVKSYIRRTGATTKHQTKKRALSKSASDAIHGVDREIESLGKSAEDGLQKAIKAAKNNVRGRPIKQTTLNRDGSLSPANKKFVESFNRRVSQTLAEIGEDGHADSVRKAKEIAKEVVERASSRASTPKSARSMSPEASA